MSRNTKVTGNEECVSQHKHLFCDMKILSKQPWPHKAPRRRKIWKLKNPSVSKEFEQLFSEIPAESNNGKHNIDDS